MIITVKDLTTENPQQGLFVTVDGAYAGVTDANGQILSSPQGTMVVCTGVFKLLYSDPGDDREIWINGVTGSCSTEI